MAKTTEAINANSPSGQIGFSKLEALGNDFVLIDARERTFDPDPGAVRDWADRRTGVGFDQLLILRRDESGRTHCRVDIHNRDGSRAEQCGNGMRAVALWLSEREEVPATFGLRTEGGDIGVRRVDRARFETELGIPELTPAAIGLSDVDAFPWTVEVAGERLSAHGVSVGNPHLVVIEAETATPERLAVVGAALGAHPSLAHGANVSLATRTGQHRTELRVYERGAGATRACGSAAAAAAIVLIDLGHAVSPVEVVQPGGTLVVNWLGPGHPVAVSGPACHVFEGVMPWPNRHP
jgi:diaminopimelate epimerase